MPPQHPLPTYTHRTPFPLYLPRCSAWSYGARLASHFCMGNVKLGRFAIQISPYFLGPDGDLVKKFSVSASAPDLRAGGPGGRARRGRGDDAACGNRRAGWLSRYGRKGKEVRARGRGSLRRPTAPRLGAQLTTHLGLRHPSPRLRGPVRRSGPQQWVVTPHVSPLSTLGMLELGCQNATCCPLGPPPGLLWVTRAMVMDTKDWDGLPGA